MAARGAARLRAATLAAVAAAAGAGGFLLGRAWDREAGPPGPGAPTLAASAIPPTSTSATAPGSADAANAGGLLALAASGDPDALKQLERGRRDGRTPDEAMALARGYAAQARADAERLVSDLRAQPELLADPGTLRYAYGLALDPDVGPTLLAGLASLDAPIVADLLDDLVTRGEPGARLTLLAEDLLLGPAVRPEASKALAALLDLRAAKECWQIAAVLARAAAAADARASARLEALTAETGCGKDGTGDCYPCLRDAAAAAELGRAVDRAKATPFVAPWRARLSPPR